MDSTDLSESYDSVIVGSARRIPIKLPNISPDMDLNQVELEVIDESREFADRPEPPPERAPTHRKKKQEPTKVRVLMYFACCLCICRKNKAAVAVVPTVANKYMVSDALPY